ncbi:helix-turn-helix domain-containing protein [Bacteroides sp.]|uniref:helix-turn-helix domain-containing protein n=1 Tax=Bacteroides sp. TaxID=29523 RepID=UPI003AB740E0
MKYLLPLLLLLFPLFVRAGHEVVSDSLLHDRYIQSIHLRTPDRALQLLDSAEQRHLPDMEPFKIDMLRAMCYEVKNENLLKEKYTLRALEADSVRLVPHRKLRMLTLLVSALEGQGKYEEGIRLCREVVDLARRLNNRAEEGEMLFVMGRIYAGMNRLDEALEAFNASISLMEDIDDIRVMAQLSTAYGELMTVLITNGRRSDAIDIGRRRENLVRHMTGKPGPPPGYIDQQQAYVCSKMAYLLQQEGKTDEAKGYYHCFMETDFAHITRNKQEIIPYLLEAHRYREALQLNDTVASVWHGDTVNFHYYTMLDRYAQAYRGLQLYDKADAYQLRISVLQDSLYSREKESRAQEYASVFRLNEKELQLAKTRTLAQHRSFMLAGSGVIIVLMSALLGVIWCNLRMSRKRNRIAVKQIDELLAQRENLHKTYEKLEAALVGSASVTSVETGGKDSIGSAPDAPAKTVSDSVGGTFSKTDSSLGYTLFMRMERLLLEQNLFLQPNFGRDDLLRISNINKNDLPRLLKRYADANNVNDYLNRLRVEYAVKLMKEKPFLSINGIAQEANFNSYVTFYRAFYRIFGLTPIQYMKANGKS